MLHDRAVFSEGGRGDLGGSHRAKQWARSSFVWGGVRAKRPSPGDALEGKAPQRRPQKRLDLRLEEVAKAVGGGYCWLQMPLKLALANSRCPDMFVTNFSLT